MSQDRIQASRFAGILARLDPSDPVLHRFCEAGRLMLGAEAAAITMRYDQPERYTVSATSPLALTIEQTQELVGEGPGFDAARSGNIVEADFSGSKGTPWAALADSFADLKISGTIVAVPISARDRHLGVLVAFTSTPPPRGHAAAAQYLERALGPVLMDHLDPATLEEELSENWSSRAVVHQATGMLIFALRISAVDALALLRAHAYAESCTLVEVAAQVVSQDLRFDEFSLEEE